MKNPTKLNILSAALVLALAGSAVAGQKIEDKKMVAPVETPDFPVHPISDPYWSEDSFIGTDLRPVFAWHHFPGEPLGSGYATVFAAQLRIKLTKSLQFVAYKDGYMDIHTKGYKDRGWNDLAAGLKWAFLQNDELKLHAAVGVGYEFASGDDNILQDDDGLRFWASVNKTFGKLHLGVTANYFWATDNGDDWASDSNIFSWHFHADYQVCNWFSPVVEVNGYHVMDEGDVVTPFSATDALNVGGNKNESVITVAVGAEVRPLKNVALRAAYEVPLSSDVDIWGQRWTFSSVISF